MEILFVVVVDRKIEIHTTTGIFTGSIMVQLERILSLLGIVKVEQSYLANLDKACFFDTFNMKLQFSNGKSCPVSYRNKRKISTYFDKRRGG